MTTFTINIRSTSFKHHVLIHKDVFRYKPNVDTQDAFPKITLLAHRLGTNADIPFKYTKGINHGWRRTSLKEAFHFYLWWTTKGATPVKAFEAQLRSYFPNLANYFMIIRAIRQHDDTSDLMTLGHPSEYELLDLHHFDFSQKHYDFKDREVHILPEPWTEEQKTFIDSQFPIRLLMGQPGTGKTTCLWESMVRTENLEKKTMERKSSVLYITWSQKLKAESQRYFDAYQDIIEIKSIEMRELFFNILGDQKEYMQHFGMDQFELYESFRKEIKKLTDYQLVKQIGGDSDFYYQVIRSWFFGREIFAKKRAYLQESPQNQTKDQKEEELESDEEVMSSVEGKDAQIIEKIVSAFHFNFDKNSKKNVSPHIIKVHESRKEQNHQLLFPDLWLAKKAYQKLKDAKDKEMSQLIEKFDCFDSFVIDEVQDLTPLEFEILLILLQRLKREKENRSKLKNEYVFPFKLLIAGDEGQIVRATDFDWGELGRQIHQSFPNSQFQKMKLSKNLRNEENTKKILTQVSSYYRHLEKAFRPKNQIFDKQDLDLQQKNQNAYYLEIGEYELLSQLIEFSDKRADVVLVALQYDQLQEVFKKGQKQIDAQSIDGFYTPSIVKGLEYPVVMIVGVSQMLHTLNQTHLAIETPLLYKSKVNELRVSISRSTQSIIFVELSNHLNLEGQVEAFKERVLLSKQLLNGQEIDLDSLIAQFSSQQDDIASIKEYVNDLENRLERSVGWAWKRLKFINQLYQDKIKGKQVEDWALEREIHLKNLEYYWLYMIRFYQTDESAKNNQKTEITGNLIDFEWVEKSCRFLNLNVFLIEKLMVNWVNLIIFRKQDRKNQRLLHLFESICALSLEDQSHFHWIAKYWYKLDLEIEVIFEELLENLHFQDLIRINLDQMIPFIYQEFDRLHIENRLVSAQKKNLEILIKNKDFISAKQMILKLDPDLQQKYYLEKLLLIYQNLGEHHASVELLNAKGLQGQAFQYLRDAGAYEYAYQVAQSANLPELEQYDLLYAIKNHLSFYKPQELMTFLFPNEKDFQQKRTEVLSMLEDLRLTLRKNQNIFQELVTLKDKVAKEEQEALAELRKQLEEKDKSFVEERIQFQEERETEKLKLKEQQQQLENQQNLAKNRLKELSLENQRLNHQEDDLKQRILKLEQAEKELQKKQKDFEPSWQALEDLNQDVIEQQQNLQKEKDDLANREKQLVEDQEYFLAYKKENDVLETEIEYLENQLSQEKSGFLSREREWQKERDAFLAQQQKLQAALSQLKYDHLNLKDQMTQTLMEFHEIQNQFCEIDEIRRALDLEKQALELENLKLKHQPYTLPIQSSYQTQPTQQKKGISVGSFQAHLDIPYDLQKFYDSIDDEDEQEQSIPQASTPQASIPQASIPQSTISDQIILPEYHLPSNQNSSHPKAISSNLSNKTSKPEVVFNVKVKNGFNDSKFIQDLNSFKELLSEQEDDQEDDQSQDESQSQDQADHQSQDQADHRNISAEYFNSAESTKESFNHVSNHLNDTIIDDASDHSNTEANTQANTQANNHLLRSNPSDEDADQKDENKNLNSNEDYKRIPNQAHQPDYRPDESLELRDTSLYQKKVKTAPLAPGELKKFVIYSHLLESEVDELTMVFCPKGDLSFKMPNQNKSKKVEVRPFWISQIPITRNIWEAVMFELQHQEPHADPLFPVTQINWIDAVLFCNQLSKMSNLTPAYHVQRNEIRWDDKANGFRLPMEYEWEYAARAGKAGDLYAGSNLLELVGWFDANANQQVQALKLKHPNQWNIYDMCGDVWEWCHEVYVQQTVHINADLYEKNPNAPWSDRTKERILKGGDFLSEADKCLITHRMIKDREQYVNLKSGAAYGMRVVKPI